MKYRIAAASATALLLLSSCRPSPEKLLATANKYHANKQYREASILYQKVINKDKKNAEAYYREGINLIDMGSPAEAAGYLRRAIDLNPGNTDAESRLANVYLTAYISAPQRFKQALTEVEDLKNRILKVDPNSFDGLRLQALLDMANQKLDNALPIFAKANKIKPHSRDLVGWYAQALANTGHGDEAVSLIRDTLAHDKTWGAGYDILFVYYEHNKDAQKAEAVLRERVANNPDSAMAITNLANYLSASGHSDEAESVMKRVLSDKKAFPDGHEMMGNFYVRQHKYDQALQQFQTGAQDDTAHELAYQERIVATYKLMGRNDDALKLAKQLADKNPKDKTSNEMYASLLLDSGSQSNLSKSLGDLETLVKNNPTDPVLRLQLAKAYLNNKESDRALNEVNEALQDEGKSRTPRPGVTVPGHMLAAHIYESKGQHAQALEQCTQILQADPANPEARLLHDQALIGLNEPDQAIPDLKKLLEQYPQLNDARIALGGVFLGQHNFPAATEQFQAAWAAKDARGYFGLQETKLAEGKPEEGIKGMQELADKYPTVPIYRFELANLETAAGFMAARTNPDHAKSLLGDAIQNFKIVAKDNPNNAAVWLRLGTLQQQLGQSDAALASFQQAAKADPKNATALVSEASILDSQGRKKEAIDLYNRVLGMDPNNAVALNNLAFLEADSGTNLDQAMTFAERAKKEAPKSPDISDTLGYVYLRKNLNAAALDIFKQNVQEQPQNPMYHLHLAMALLKNGDKQAAREEAQKALKTARPNQQAQIQAFVNQIG